MKPLIFTLSAVFALSTLAAQLASGSRLGTRRWQSGRAKLLIHNPSEGRKLSSLPERRFWSQAGRWLA